jgi:hypothetical protein
MDLMHVAKKIPIETRTTVIEKLVDLVLNSKNAEKMPSGLAKTILFYWQRDQLATDVGIERLLQAATLLEPESTILFLKDELGLAEAAALLKEALTSK